MATAAENDVYKCVDVDKNVQDITKEVDNMEKAYKELEVLRFKTGMLQKREIAMKDVAEMGSDNLVRVAMDLERNGVLMEDLGKEIKRKWNIKKKEYVEMVDQEQRENKRKQMVEQLMQMRKIVERQRMWKDYRYDGLV